MGRTSTEPPPDLPAALRPVSASVPVRGARGGKPWLWPHLLSLDAPLVALVWQDWWGRSVGEPPAPVQRLILGLGVWAIYLADRLADNVRDRPGEGAATTRHAFAREHRWSLLGVAVLVVGMLAALAPLGLPTDQFRSGLLLLAAAGLYFCLIHRPRSPRWTRWLPKEAVVGGMFASGTAFFVFCRPVPTPLLLITAVAFFGVVCFLNCALITSWERTPRDRRDPASFLNAFPTLAGSGLRAMCWGVVAAAVAAGWGWHTQIFTPILLAATALAVLDAWRGRLSGDALRCLVDLVLLTPGVCLGAAAVFRWVGPFYPR